jgi:hypothetical protein
VHELFFNVQNPIRFDLWFRMSFGWPCPFGLLMADVGMSITWIQMR